MNIKKSYLIFVYFYVFMHESIHAFSIIMSQFSKLKGRWSIKGSKAVLHIEDKRVTMLNGNAQIVMRPKMINNDPLKIHLDSLQIKKYPSQIDHNAFTALAWIHNIKKNGIDLEINATDSEIVVNWLIKGKKGELTLEKMY